MPRLLLVTWLFSLNATAALFPIKQDDHEFFYSNCSDVLAFPLKQRADLKQLPRLFLPNHNLGDEFDTILGAAGELLYQHAEGNFSYVVRSVEDPVSLWNRVFKPFPFAVIFNQQALSLGSQKIKNLSHHVIPAHFHRIDFLLAQAFDVPSPHLAYDIENRKIFVPIVFLDPKNRHEPLNGRSLALPRVTLAQAQHPDSGLRALDASVLEERALLRAVSEIYLQQLWVWLVLNSEAKRGMLTSFSEKFQTWFANQTLKRPLKASLEKEFDPYPHSEWKAHLEKRFFAEVDFALLMLYVSRLWVPAHQMSSTVVVGVNPVFDEYYRKSGYSMAELARQLAYFFILEQYETDAPRLFRTGAFEDLDGPISELH